MGKEKNHNERNKREKYDRSYSSDSGSEGYSRNRRESSKKHHKSRSGDQITHKKGNSSQMYKTIDNAALQLTNSKVSDKFVWKKKVEKDRKEGRKKGKRGREDEVDTEEENERIREEQEYELEKLQKLKEAKLKEQEYMERQKILMIRENEEAMMGQNWEQKEQQLHLTNLVLKAIKKIGRDEHGPVDLFIVYLHYYQETEAERRKRIELGQGGRFGLELELMGILREKRSRYSNADVTDELSIYLDPWKAFSGIADIEQLERIKMKIKEYRKAEITQSNKEYWKGVGILCQDRIDSVKKHNRSGIKVNNEIKDMMQGKSAEKLDELQEMVLRKIGEKSVVIDRDYWEQVLEQIKVFKAALSVSHVYECFCKDYILSKNNIPQSYLDEHQVLSNSKPNEDSVYEEEFLRQINEQNYKRQKRGHGESEDEEAEEGDELVNMDRSAEVISAAGTLTEANGGSITNREQRREEDPLKKKPRYFNKVHTGYEWNKYNQTHYDFDNPPPKVIQGYKFNIFYPELNDKSKAPTYKIEPDPLDDSGNTVIIRFIAGAPYSDVAFRIVNKEWEMSRKRGFRNSFDKNVLQLYFKFKRYFYRK
ncbi:Cactin [Zancudomyces culisetae]|uniref:Splicing factor Cactin n=1 Tax=Zancudomyces culisetae TaxID=1213189 RepID=A0A1R1PXK2_ZANCU|nr:Cactin [Zancudomyces culisetae]|eukprot:OMH85673.1 Cactin [Zancudomyces culisetae]